MSITYGCFLWTPTSVNITQRCFLLTPTVSITYGCFLLTPTSVNIEMFLIDTNQCQSGFPPEKNLWGDYGGDTNLLRKRGICLLNTFLKDFTKMAIKKNTVLQFDGGDIPPLAKIMGGINPPRPPLWRRPCQYSTEMFLIDTNQCQYNTEIFLIDTNQCQ